MAIVQFPPSDRFWIFLTDLNEPEENSLRLAVTEAIVVPPIEKVLGIAVTPIKVRPESLRFELFWKDYIAYSVRNESFA
jgi:hypothetical protein